jgi:uncharacterized protein
MTRILISGASGLIGAALVSAFESSGYEVFRLVRRAPRHERELPWDPEHALPSELVSGFNAVIHLSGESVAGRWTVARKQRIRDSRVLSTANLANAIASAKKPPQTFICASAIGYYGNRGDELLTEDSPSGSGFLAEVSREWEAAASPAANAGTRVVNIRIGVVLSRDGGALKQMLLPFRLGLGGKIGNGHQWLSWIHIEDLVAAVSHIIDGWIVNDQTVERRAPAPALLSGPVNMVAPNPVTNAEFTSTLANALHRPAFFAVPAFGARLAFGEFAEEGLLSSARVIPERLLHAHFRFKFPALEEALIQLLASRSSLLG